MILCDSLEVSLDYLLRDVSDTPYEDKKQELTSSYTPYLGRWLQIFLKDKEFNGFYRVGLIAIQNTRLLLMDEKRKAVLLDISSVCTISALTDEKQTGKLPMLPASETIPNANDYFINRNCDIKLKQGQPLFGFNKPGGFYSVLVTGISDEVITAQDRKGKKHTVKMSDVLFIKECP